MKIEFNGKKHKVKINTFCIYPDCRNATNAKSLLSIFKMEKKRHRRNIETMQGLKEIVHLIVFISQQLPQRRKTYNCNKKKKQEKNST